MNNSDSVIKNAAQQIKNLGMETVKEFGKAAGQITKGIGVGELLGDINSMSDEELQKRKMEDEKKKKEEEQKLKAQMKGNNLEEEMKKLREKSADAKAMADKQEMEQKKKESADAKAMADKEEEAAIMMGNPHKQKKKRGSAFLPADKKSQTAEYAKKPD